MNKKKARLLRELSYLIPWKYRLLKKLYKWEKKFARTLWKK